MIMQYNAQYTVFPPNLLWLPLVMPDAMESTRLLIRVVYIAFALRHEPERNICSVARRFGIQ
jgi:hypothetical protein